MRALLVALIVTGCGGDDAGGPVDIHEIVACDDAWVRNGYTQCERACANSTVALTASGPMCSARTSTGPVDCSKTFEFQGVAGCCASNPGKQLFGECD